MKIRKIILTITLITIMIIFVGQVIFVLLINFTNHGVAINKELSSELTSIIESVESRITGKNETFLLQDYTYNFSEPYIDESYLQRKGEVLDEITQRMRLEICLSLADQPELLRTMYKSQIISGDKAIIGDFFPDLGIVIEEKKELMVNFFSVKKQYNVYLGITGKGETAYLGTPERVTEYWLSFNRDQKFNPHSFTSNLLPPFSIIKFELKKSFLTGRENINIKFLTPKDRKIISYYIFRYR